METSPKQVVTYKLIGQGRLGRRHADHVHRLQVHLGADRQRRPDIYDTTGYDEHRVGRRHRPANACVVTFKNPYAAWKGPVRRPLRHLPVAPARGQGPQRRDEGRLHVLRRPLEDREVGEGRRRRRSCPTPSTGVTSPSSTRSCSSSSPTPPHEFQAFKAGEVLAIYPQPQLATRRRHRAGGLDATQIVLDQDRQPRGAVDEQLEGAARLHGRSPGPRLRPRPRRDRRGACSAASGQQGGAQPQPADRRKYSDTEAFAEYKKDLDKVDEPDDR